MDSTRNNPNNASESLWQTLTNHGLKWLNEQECQEATQNETLVVFRLGSECFHIPARHVHDIQPLGSYTPIPLIDACIIGVVTVQDRSVGVVDIRPLISHSRKPPQPGASLLIVHVNDVEVGLLADAIIAVPHTQSVGWGNMHWSAANTFPLERCVTA